MTEALTAVLVFSFEKLNLGRIQASTFGENVKSYGLLRKVGFSEEGLRKKSIRSKSTGEFHDERMFGFLKEDWIDKKQ